MEDLLIVTTGGTIDKIYFDDKSDYQIGDPQIGQILKELGVTFRFSVTPIIRKDSLHITDADRELIRATIAAQPIRHVLITTARFDGGDRQGTADDRRQDHRDDRRVEPGALPRLGRRIQYRLRSRCCAIAAGRRLYRHERPHLEAGKSAQERGCQPLRIGLTP